MFRIFTLFVLFSPLSVNAGALDGKSLVCEPIPSTDPYSSLRTTWFLFGPNHVNQYLVGSDEVEDLGKMAITETANAVTWKYMNAFPWSLDRKTLTLTNPAQIAVNAATGKRLIWQYECEVLLTKEEFFARIEAYRLNKRLELMKGNKI